MPETLILSAPGNYTFIDDGIDGNGRSHFVVDGLVFSFAHPTDALIIAAGDGVNITFNITESFDNATVQIGSFFDSAVRPDSIAVNSLVTDSNALLFSDGAISEAGSDAGIDIRAGGLLMSAGGAIGASLNPLEIATGSMEAESRNGGIFLSHFGDLVIGGLSPDVAGLRVHNSGSISVTTVGRILLHDSDGDATVRSGSAAGNVTLVANGAEGRISSNVDNAAVVSPRGNIVLRATDDIALGDGDMVANDVLAHGNVNIVAGRQFDVGGMTHIFSDAFSGTSGGDVSIAAGGGIGISAIPFNQTQIAALGSAGGNVTLTAGPGSGIGISSSSNGTRVRSASGDVTFVTDDLSFDRRSDVSAAGDMTIVPATAGRDILIGGIAGEVPGMLTLELDEIGSLTVGGRLTIGSQTSGSLTVQVDTIKPDADSLSLVSGSDIFVRSNVIAPTLELRAVRSIQMSSTGGFEATTIETRIDTPDTDDFGGDIHLLGTVTTSSIVQVTGGLDDDRLAGSNADDSIQAFSGDDQLDGRAGADLMDGATGNDTYVVDDAGDLVIDSAGIERIFSSVTFTLGAGLENLRLTGLDAIDGIGNALDNEIIGNNGANLLRGGAGNDLLDGGNGPDRMEGGTGDDLYGVTDTGDVVVEVANGGIDHVGSIPSFTLPAFVENLTIGGNGSSDGTGNNLDNILVGNHLDNVLDGRAGADTMEGGAGNDTFVVDQSGDVVTDAEGIDTVQSAITYVLGATIENLVLTGTANLDGNGNVLDNSIRGNNGANRLAGGGGNDFLDGGLGADRLTGGTGDDIFVVDQAGDQVVEAAGGGTDLIISFVTLTLGAAVENLKLEGTANIAGTGNGGANSVTGNVGNNFLDGGVGADTMTGLAGNDTYVVDNAGDTVVEEPGQGNDTVRSRIGYTLGVALENLILTGTGAINGTGNAGTNTLVGNDGANRLDGGVGADVMRGGLGNDVYIVNQVGETVTELSGQGTDRVESAVSFSLGTAIENLTLTGSNNANGTGNNLANILVGNSASNVLNGGVGADTMRGGLGNDTYVVDNAGDQVVEFASSAGVDRVNASVGYTLTANVENLTLLGSGAINGTGNAIDNSINGNSGNNVLKGLGGGDVLVGLGGADHLYGGTGIDLLSGGAGADAFHFDTVLNATTNVDDMVDFAPAADSVMLDRAIFTALSTGTLAAGAFVLGTSAGDVDDRILYDAASGQIFYDRDGTGAAASVLFATVLANTALTNADFIAYG